MTYNVENLVRLRRISNFAECQFILLQTSLLIFLVFFSIVFFRLVLKISGHNQFIPLPK